MKIDKAKEILEAHTHEDEYLFSDDDVDAVKLGIEALKRVKNTRRPHSYFKEVALPGETTD